MNPSKTNFDQLCNEYLAAENDKDKIRIGLKFRNLIGHRLNEHGVFATPKYINVINHKSVIVAVEYIETPHGYLVTLSHQFYSGSGGGFVGPITIFDALHGHYIQDLNAYAHQAVKGLSSDVKDANVPEVAKRTINRFLKQTEQVPLFKTSDVSILS